MKIIPSYIWALSPKRPYDFTLEDNIPMYDNMPYHRNHDYCNESMVHLVSGNVIKYFRYDPDVDNEFEIDNQDNEVKNLLIKLKRQEARPPLQPKEITLEMESDSESPISDEQLDILMEEQA